MRNENVIDAMEIRLEFHQLHLSSFTAVDEEMTILDFN